MFCISDTPTAKTIPLWWKVILHITVKTQERFPTPHRKNGIKYYCGQIIIAWPVSPCLYSWWYKIRKAFLEWIDKSKIETSLQDPWNYQNIFQNVSKQGPDYHPDSQGQVTLKQSKQSFSWKSNSWTILKYILGCYWVIWNKLMKCSSNFHFHLFLCPHMFSCNLSPHFSNISLYFPKHADNVFLWFSGSSKFTGGCNTNIARRLSPSNAPICLIQK